MQEENISPLEDHLLRYLDGTLDEASRVALENRLRTDPTLKAKLESLQAMDLTMHRMKWAEPSPRFTDNIMSKLSTAGLQTKNSLRNSLLLLLGTLLTIILSAMLVSAGVFDQTGTLDMNEMISNQNYIKQTLPAIPVSSKWIINTLIILNLALAFVVLDRTVLRPLFEKRSHSF